jgi:hypothetical protein
MSNRIENQQITETIPVHGLLSGANIGTWQADYPLTALDFEYIKNGKPVTFNWANSFLLTSIGFGLNLLGKGVSQWTNVKQEIYIGEWIALGCGIALSFILYFIGLVLPNNRKRVMKEIQNHFKSSPKQRQVVQGDNE